GLKAAFAKGGTILLEPLMDMDIVVPTESMGDIMGDINSRRGRVLGSEHRGKNTLIKAQCPLAEVQRYAPDLNAMSGGKGSFTMILGTYEEVPGNLIDRVVQASPFRVQSDD
ncbi:MAG: elongation factor G, partial [Myxococcota bacterium]|nr:elongation factor G [Myxococcota bacterium]